MEIQRVLVVTAHPDDVDFGAAATIAGWTAQGIEVVYCIATDGDAGGFDRSTDNGGMASLRRTEQTAAAKRIGVADLRWLGYQDGRVEATLALRRDIARVIRHVRPDRVLTHSPERNYDLIYPSHPDHRAVGGATVDAVYPDARNPYAFPELTEEAWTVPEVWLMGGPAVNHYVDVTGQVEHKIAALRAHESQTGHMTDLSDFLRDFMANTGRSGGLADGRLAEAFQVVNTA